MGEVEINEKDIRKVIDDYLENVSKLFSKHTKRAKKPIDERTSFCLLGPEHVKYLLVTKINLVEIPIRLLRRLPVYLLKQFKVQVEVDSLWYWALTRDVVWRSYRFRKLFPLSDEFLLLMAAHCADLSWPMDFSPISPKYSTTDQLENIRRIVVPQPIYDVIKHKKILIGYLCYPIIENLAKIVLSSFVDINGVVQKEFFDGKKQRHPNEEISSIAVLLRSIETIASKELSNPELGADLEDFRKETEKLIPKKREKDDGWDLIYRIRNVYLHGAGGWELRTGLLTNLICMLVLHLMENDEIKEALDYKSHWRNWGRDDEYFPPRLSYQYLQMVHERN